MPENQAIARLFPLELPSGIEPLTCALRMREKTSKIQPLSYVVCL
nr:MAG TPA: hypothetical protein [Caudoviricetes sp.]